MSPCFQQTVQEFIQHRIKVSVYSFITANFKVVNKLKQLFLRCFSLIKPIGKVVECVGVQGEVRSKKKWISPIYRNIYKYRLGLTTRSEFSLQSD